MFLLSDLGTGGTARATMLTVNGLAEVGADISLVLAQRGGVLDSGVDNRVRLLGLNAATNRGLGMFSGLSRLIGIIRSERPAQIISAGNHMHVLACLAHAAARLPTCRLVLKMTNAIERPNKSALSNAMRRTWYRWAFRRADKILVIAEPTRSEYARQFPQTARKIAVVDNPYITDAMIAAGRERHEYAAGRLLAIGRLVPQKNYPLLLDALARVAELPWTIDVLGDGPLLDELERRAERLGIAERVNFRGFVPDPLPFLHQAHALVLSSSWEGQGAVLLEALACGCPVVAARSTAAVGGVLAEGRYGRLVPPDDAAALADAIAAELKDRTRLPDSTRAWVERYRLDAGAKSHARALGICADPEEAGSRC